MDLASNTISNLLRMMLFKEISFTAQVKGLILSAKRPIIKLSSYMTELNYISTLT